MLEKEDRWRDFLLQRMYEEYNRNQNEQLSEYLLNHFSKVSEIVYVEMKNNKNHDKLALRMLDHF